jgi:hypothetical protein
MLATSIIAVFAPILLSRFLRGRVNNIALTVVKQFGTGVIIATALIHVRVLGRTRCFIQYLIVDLRSCSLMLNSCLTMSVLAQSYTSQPRQQ